jgi:hypothetical protein
MNRHSLVLAADSAATVSRWESGQKEERYFKGSNKIFQISDTEPVGVMIYDSADLQRVPWEIIVKTFRKSLGARSFKTLAEYANEFFSFIELHRGLFPATYLDELVVENIDHIMIRFLQMLKEDQRVKDAGDDAAAALEAKRAALQEFLRATMTYPLKGSVPSEYVDAVREEHRTRLEAEAQTNLHMFSADADLDKSILIELGVQALFRRPEFFLSETGVVVAGFGTDDYFPSYVEHVCLGFLAGRLHTEQKGKHDITQRDSGFFKAFATTAMADTFTMGFGPDVYSTVTSHLRTVLEEFSTKVCKDELPPEEVKAAIDLAVKNHTDKWTDEVFEKHGRPLRRVIGSLPIDELASLAETLVMLESLKEKVTRPSESVSGPIDVAIITKHEGFVWAKRKLYFDPKLNSRFFLRQQLEQGRRMEADDAASQA